MYEQLIPNYTSWDILQIKARRVRYRAGAHTGGGAKGAQIETKENRRRGESKQVEGKKH